MIDTNILLAWGATYRKLLPGEILFREQTHCHFYYQVVSGQLRWTNVDDEGSEYLQGLVNSGECIGELPLFDDEPYAATAIANNEVTVLFLEKTTFLKLLQEQPQIHFQFSRLLTHRLRFKFHMLKSLAQHNPDKIIRSLLAYFKHTGNHKCHSCHKILLTRKQIAEMTSLRVETVIRVMRRLEAQKEVIIARGKVYLGESACCLKENCPADAMFKKE
ncbi:MAG: Crp/Fnr family transcriptional regulator [Lacibacter sp.]|jgi:CRP-like cAMP-binding protein